MGGLEAVLTGLTDVLPVKKYRYGRESLTAVVVFAAFCLALPNVTSVRNVRHSDVTLVSSPLSSHQAFSRSYPVTNQ